MTLLELRSGQIGVVTEVSGDDAIAVRLMEMGLVEGTPLSFVGAAPLGDPLEFRVRGYRLSLRKVEAGRVSIELAAGGSSTGHAK